MLRMILVSGLAWFALACGNVQSNDIDAPLAIDAPNIDAAVDASACTPFAIPAGGQTIHSRFCVSALGFNPTATPTTMNLACPGVGTGPGTYGLILRQSETQADGCPAIDPVTRILAPAVVMGSSNALTQTSTGQDLTIAAGDRLRMRLACRDGIANCRGNVQITGAPGVGAGNMLIFPMGGGFQLVQGTDVIDVDVPFPAGLVGATTDLNLVVVFAGAGTPDILFENPHIAKP